MVQGGNTGLVGGGVPLPGPSDNPPVLLSTTRLTELGPVSRAARQVTVGAGVTLAGLTAHARAAGLDFGVDLAARSRRPWAAWSRRTLAASGWYGTGACASRSRGSRPR